jgi:two-component system, cell cycle response regulator DivK
MPKILLVEDNEMNRDMLSRRLIRNGFEVVVAVDGGQAVTMAASENPDLILMDMSLPVMDGLEATRQVKAAPGTRAIPIHRPDRQCPGRGPRKGARRRL